MNGSVLFEGSPLLSGSLNVNTGGNIEPLEVEINENGTRNITPPSGVDGYAPITIETSVPIPQPVLESIEITQNGIYTPPSGVDGYSNINVDVPEPVLDSISITANGIYTPPSGVDGYDEVNVSVPTPEPVLDTLNVTSNGTYTPPSGVDGYDEVNVSVSGYTIKTLSTTPTSIASFTDGTANPLKSLTASIVPMQAGSGDPSPTNVRPITGWTEEVVTRMGVNIWDEEWESGIIDDSGERPSAGSIRSKNYSRCLPLTSYYKYKGNDFSGIVVVAWYDSEKNQLSRDISSGGLCTSPNNAYYFRLSLYAYGTTYKNDISINYPSTDTEYHAYAGTTTTIPFTDGQGQSVEVFGGSVDVVNGGGSDYKEYDSYNGETLIGPWISDRDVYVPNTSPTIGAQVVDMGDTTTFYTQPTSIKSLDGVNNVFASTGDVEELEYFANL